MAQIQVRPAADAEKLNIDEELPIPKGVRVYDSSDHEANLFFVLVDGDYVVSIQDEEGALRCVKGLFIIHLEDDVCFVKSTDKF